MTSTTKEVNGNRVKMYSHDDVEKRSTARKVASAIGRDCEQVYRLVTGTGDGEVHVWLRKESGDAGRLDVDGYEVSEVFVAGSGRTCLTLR